MNPFHRVMGPVALAAMPLVLAAGAHITPTVVLKKHADVIRQTLPKASSFFVRTVEIGRADANRIKQAAGYTPEDPEVKFFYGTEAGGAVEGVVFFPQVNTQHGPFEVGLTIGPNGAITSANVTKATVETKPWVKKVIDAGLMKQFVGLRPGDDAQRALASVSKDELGSMPYYAAEVLTTAVARGLALYSVLYPKQ